MQRSDTNENNRNTVKEKICYKKWKQLLQNQMCCKGKNKNQKTAAKGKYITKVPFINFLTLHYFLYLQHFGFSVLLSLAFCRTFFSFQCVFACDFQFALSLNQQPPSSSSL